MYHYPALNSPDFQEEHARRLRRYEGMDLDEVLRQAELPICNSVGLREPVRNGVVLIENIPYTVTRPEIVQFFGRRAPVLPMSQFPVHIIMERSTGKTMNCYVEFQTENQAREAVYRVNRITDAAPLGPRMGNRQVDVSLSSQDELLKAIFPRAKSVDWVNGVPREREAREPWSAGFDGFLTEEELFCVARHAKDPQRSPFAGKVPQRPYESMISTICKFPWFATSMYTVYERNELYKTLRDMIEHLLGRVDSGHIVGLDHRLVAEMVQAGLRCPGFNPRMKFRLAEAGRDRATLERMSQEYLTYFPFDTLTWMSPFDVTFLTFYASLIAKGRVSRTEQDGLANIHRNPAWLEPYGRYLFVWTDEMAKHMKFADAIAYEMGILRTLIISGHGGSAPRGAHAHHPSLVPGPRSVAEIPGRRRASTSAALVLQSQAGTHGSPFDVQASTADSDDEDDFFPGYHHLGQGSSPYAASGSSSGTSQHWRQGPAPGGGAYLP